MTENGEITADLGAKLRALRRRADLSQRELATASGIPASTIARIESSAAPNPHLRTLERLVRAAGGTLTVALRPVREAKDWWGAWWADWYNLPRERWPRQAPDHTFDLDRDQRDHRRRRGARRRLVAEVRIDRVRGPEQPDSVWCWTATDPRSEALVGWLGGFVRRRRVDREQEFVLCDIEVVRDWRRGGLGRRLVGALRAYLTQERVPRARVLIDEADLPHEFFRSCGFVLRGQQPAWLMLPVPV